MNNIFLIFVTLFKSTMIWCVSNGLCTSQVNIKRMLLSLVWFKHSLLKIIRTNIDCHLNEHVSFLVCPCNRSCPYLSLPQPVLITYYLFDKSVALEAYWSTVMLIDAWFEAITSAFPNQMRNQHSFCFWSKYPELSFLPMFQPKHCSYNYFYCNYVLMEVVDSH